MLYDSGRKLYAVLNYPTDSGTITLRGEITRCDSYKDGTSIVTFKEPHVIQIGGKQIKCNKVTTNSCNLVIFHT